jgi:hypothetical protein
MQQWYNVGKLTWQGMSTYIFWEIDCPENTVGRGKGFVKWTYWHSFLLNISPWILTSHHIGVCMYSIESLAPGYTYSMWWLPELFRICISLTEILPIFIYLLFWKEASVPTNCHISLYMRFFKLKIRTRQCGLERGPIPRWDKKLPGSKKNLWNYFFRQQTS